MNCCHSDDASGSGTGRIVLAALGLIVAGLFAYSYQSPILAVLPFLVLLACPLMHLFRHRQVKGDNAR